MSQQLINRNPDLKQLQSEGFCAVVGTSGHLIIHKIPYVNSQKEIRYGILVSDLELAGDHTNRPNNHTVKFAGEYPCNKDGQPLKSIEHQQLNEDIGGGIILKYSFSSKPKNGYDDYFHKMSTYAALISGHAEAIDPSVTARPKAVIEVEDSESSFKYLDTASSRCEISAISRKLKLKNIAIVGLGGTGAYILDQVAKTPVIKIHLFDGDELSSHNAFRSPGATSLAELRNRPRKVQYYEAMYSNMHNGIEAHDVYIDESNIQLLSGMDFVFLCLDQTASSIKKQIVTFLELNEIAFIDTGIGLLSVENKLLGVLRVTLSTNEKRDHVHTKQRIPFSDSSIVDEYSKNIQVAELNALAANLAVIRWKKHCGFYLDLEQEHFCTFTIDGNSLINEDHLAFEKD